ncbi:TadE/TadG family type IV pilus assembly protein [Candidatus Chlorohelix sp.]|uniref:TadE/TadG family type IV pilus assembly protein n=1 Tax=Candidatus Chlorohelix sp. TaxID=3139201 RepID=UPI0030237055
MFYLKNLRKPASGNGLRRSESGQSLLEFAIALPFLLMLIVVMVEVGFLLRTHTSVVSTVRESVRNASSAGNFDPYYPDYTPTMQDGDYLIVSLVNTNLSDQIGNIKLVTTYRADSTAGRTGTGTGDGKSTVWPVVTTVAQGGRTSGSPFQRVFAKNTGSTLYTTQVLTGTACTTALTAAGMPTAGSNPCGYNWIPTSTDSTKLPPRKTEATVYTNTTATSKDNRDPWYPTFRRCKDITQGITSDISQSLTNSNYYNNPLPEASAHWLAVRIDYSYNWNNTTGVLGFLPPTTFSDRAIKILEPNPAC